MPGFFRALSLAVAGAWTLSGAPLAAADPENGEKLFKQRCLVCHTTEPGAHRVGPSMAEVYGRPCAVTPKAPFPRYSSGYQLACAEAPFVWDEARLDAYLNNPSGFIAAILRKSYRSPMTLRVQRPEERADLIAYLKTLR